MMSELPTGPVEVPQSKAKFAKPAPEKRYDFPVSEQVVRWMRDVSEEIFDTIPLTGDSHGQDYERPVQLDMLPKWATHWRPLVAVPNVLVKEATFEDLAPLNVRCEVNLDKKSFEFSYGFYCTGEH